MADFLYDRIKQSLRAQIDGGSLSGGQKVPSLRRMSRDMGVSISTVMQAYLELEREGLIEARPQSGFYVCQQVAVEAPRVSTPSNRPIRARRSDIYRSVVGLMGDRDVIPLAAALPDPQLMPGKALAGCMRKVLSDQDSLMVQYSGISGLPQLKAQIAYHMLNKGVAVRPDEILITNGATESAYLVLRALTRPGDMVLVESPAYYGVINLLDNLGLYALEIATDPASGIDMRAFRRAVAHYDIKAVMLQPSFGNPLGGLYPDEKRREIVAVCAEAGVPLIEDDVYGDLSHSGRVPHALRAHDERVIYLSSFSKTIAPGCRVGWIIAGSYQDAVLDQRIAASLSNSGPSQAAVAAYLASGRYSRQIRVLARTFADQSRAYRSRIQHCFPVGTRITDPKGGFLLWVELPEEIDTMELYNVALSEGIVFSPGALFSAQDRYTSHMRINCGYPLSERIEGAIRRLGQLAQDF